MEFLLLSTFLFFIEFVRLQFHSIRKYSIESIFLFVIIVRFNLAQLECTFINDRNGTKQNCDRLCHLISILLLTTPQSKTFNILRYKIQFACYQFCMKNRGKKDALCPLVKLFLTQLMIICNIHYLFTTPFESVSLSGRKCKLTEKSFSYKPKYTFIYYWYLRYALFGCITKNMDK